MATSKNTDYPENTRFIEVVSDYLDKPYSAYSLAGELGFRTKESTFYHLFSHRNRLSLDILVKLCRRFPQVNPNYILTGEGQPLKLDKTPLEDALNLANDEIKELKKELKTCKEFNKLKDELIKSLKGDK